MSIVKKTLINENSSLLSAILKLNKTGTRCLFVVGKNNIFRGTLTDGDIRRSIVKNKNFITSINSIYNKKSFYVLEKDKRKNTKIKVHESCLDQILKSTETYQEWRGALAICHFCASQGIDDRVFPS